MESIIAAIITFIGTVISVYSASDARKSNREIKNIRDEIVKINIRNGNYIGSIGNFSNNGSDALNMGDINTKK